MRNRRIQGSRIPTRHMCRSCLFGAHNLLEPQLEVVICAQAPSRFIYLLLISAAHSFQFFELVHVSHLRRVVHPHHLCQVHVLILQLHQSLYVFIQGLLEL